MLTVEVTLLHGTIRAGAADDLALTGQPATGEWPPSPARIVAALVAGDGTRDRCRVTDGSELAVFETARPPRIHADPPEHVAVSELRERFVVDDSTGKGAVQDYPARTAREARPGVRLCPREPRLAYVWDDITPDAGTLSALRARAARVGYLGCADSPTRLVVHTGPPSASMPASVWEPGDRGATILPVPFEGYIDVLDTAFDQFLAGKKVRRSWFRAEHGRYRAPGEPDGSDGAAGTVVWLRFDRPVPGRRVLAVTETLRDAFLDLYQRHVAGPAGEVPALLHGHGRESSSARPGDVRWLALPDAGHPYARGRIHGAAVWLPAGTPAEVVEGVRTVAWHLRELVRPGWFSTGVRPHTGAGRPWAAMPRRWQGPSRRWTSVFPVVHERFVRPRPTLADVASWCEHAGLPAPIAFRESRSPLVRGAVSLHPREVQRAGRPSAPYSHFEIEFADPVTGPIAIGRARQFGLGLCAPMADETAGEERTDA